MENPTTGHSAENILMEHPDDHLQMQTPMVNEQQENDITSDESPSRCQDIVKAKCRDMKELRDALRALSEKGKKILPVNQKKIPRIKNWTENATSDWSQIEDWWKMWPDSMIGMQTGAINGFWVLDLDRHDEAQDGVASFDALCAEHDCAVDTLTIATPSGGRHLYFRYPSDGRKIGNKICVAPGIDVRSDGGMAIYPPSKNDAGKSYTILRDTDIKDAPEWLLSMVAHQEHKGDDHANPETVYIDTDVERNLPYLKKVMENAVAGIRNSTEGNRNQNLFKQAAGVAAFVASGQLSEEEVFPLLEAAAKEAGLEEREIKSTLQSALAHGRKHPRVAPPPHESPDMKSCFGGKTQNSVMPIFPRPPRIFPDNVQTMLEEACRAYTTPPPVAVATLLALLSALVGRRRGISPKSSWVEYGNLWIALVAPSGIGKSPLAKAFFKPLMDKDYEMDRAWRIARELYEEELLEYDKARKSKNPDAGFIAKPVEPVREQCLANDVTMEALADILNDNPGGILWYVDELSGMFSDFDKYSGKVGGTKDRLLSAYDCSKWDINRKDKSKNIYIPHACVGIYGGIQPKRLSTAFSQSDKDSGFLQRFILIGASIEKAPLLNSHEMSEESLALLKAIVKHLGTMTVFDGKAQSGDAPLVLELDEGALRIFEDWHNRHVIQAHTHYANKDDALYSRAMKQRSIALRICLLLYCLEEAIKRDDLDDSVLAPGPIPEYTMLNAVLLTDWLASHSDICWGLLTNPDMEALSPIQQAVIRVVTDLEDAITADKGIIKVSDLKPLIEEETGMKITPQQLNQEAQKLDLQPGRSSSSRFFKVPPRVMDSLKHLANSVTSVTAAGIA